MLCHGTVFPSSMGGLGHWDCRKYCKASFPASVISVKRAHCHSRKHESARDNVLPTDLVTLMAKSEIRQDVEDEVLVSQKEAQLEMVGNNRGKVFWTKLF